MKKTVGKRTQSRLAKLAVKRETIVNLTEHELKVTVVGGVEVKVICSGWGSGCDTTDPGI